VRRGGVGYKSMYMWWRVRSRGIINRRGWLIAILTTYSRAALKPSTKTCVFPQYIIVSVSTFAYGESRPMGVRLSWILGRAGRFAAVQPCRCTLICLWASVSEFCLWQKRRKRLRHLSVHVVTSSSCRKNPAFYLDTFKAARL